MGVLVFLLVVGAIGGGVWWNHRNAGHAMDGVSFLVPYSPSAVAAAIDAAHNRGAKATVRGMLGGLSVSAIGPTGFATHSKVGDAGEISISRDPIGSLVTARALQLYVGVPPRQLNTSSNGIWGFSVAMTHRLYMILGITPGAAKVKRWHAGLETRINKALVRASA